MADQPTSIPPAAPSGPQEDYRIATARWALAASTEAKSTDIPAAQMWGRVEAALQGVLDAIDEGKASAPVDVEALSDDELSDRLGAQIDVMQPLVDELKRRRENQS